MSRFDFGTIDPNSKSGAQLALDLNKFRDALNSGHKGNVRPVYAQAGMLWVRETSSTQWDLMLFDGDTDFAIRSINPTTNTLLQIPSSQIGGLGTAALANLTTSQTDATAGRVLRVGDFGLGGSPAADTADPNALQFSCFFSAFNSAKMPTLATFYGIHVQRDAGTVRASQIVWCTETTKTYTRTRQGVGWSAWAEFYTTANVGVFMRTLLPAVNAADARVTLGASNLGVGQTLRTRDAALNTNYTNSSDGPIFVTVRAVTDGSSMPGNKLALQVAAGNQYYGAATPGSGTGYTILVCGIVPNGAVYRVNSVNATLIDWTELSA